MKRSVQSHAEQTAQNVTNCFHDLTASLNTRQDELMDEVEELKKAKLKSLEIQLEELEAAVEIVENSVGFTEKAYKHGSEVEILNMRKQMSSRLQELNATKWQLEPCADDAVKFEADDQLKQEVATFGLITNVVTHAGASMITMGHGSEGILCTTRCVASQLNSPSLLRSGMDKNERKEGILLRHVVLMVPNLKIYTGKHSCKAKLIGKVQEGFSFGVVTSSRGSHGTLANLGNWWLWNSTRMKHLLSLSNIDAQESTINHCASNDIIEMYLDRDAGTLKMYNQRIKESDIWHGVEGDVCPVFHMTTDGDQIPLLL
ncbi:hypothetical protein ACROYT_G038517 [Oculina patagonica]